MKNIMRGFAFLISGIFLFIGTVACVCLYAQASAMRNLFWETNYGILGTAMKESYSILPIGISIIFIIVGIYYLIKS